MRNKGLVIIIWTFSLLLGVLAGTAWAEPMSAATAMIIAGGLSAGGGILGGLLGGSDEEEEWSPKYLQLPDYEESTGARGDWWSKLQEWGKDANYGAISPAWDEAWNLAKKKINQYYWGGVGDTGLAGKVKASAARRNASQSPALENQLALLGMSEAGQMSDLANTEAINKATFSENARQNWLTSLQNLAGLKPSYMTNAGMSTGGTTYGTGQMIGDISSGIGNLFSQYAQSTQTEDLLTKLLKGYSDTSLTSLTGNLGKA